MELFDESRATRRKILGLGATTAATAGYALVTQTSAAADEQSPPDSRGQYNVMDYGAKGDGVTNDTGAITATIDAAKSAALIKRATAHRGLPAIFFPPGEYVVTSLAFHQVSGLIVRGSGKGATILRTDTGTRILDLHRAANVTFKDMSLACGNYALSWTTGLVENSCGVHVEQWSTDNDKSLSTTDISFDRVEFVGLHRAIRAVGDEMGDSVSFYACKWRDNFFDFELRNGQAVNWRVFGGEVLAFVDTSETAWNPRLARWSPASVPASAASAQHANYSGYGAQQDVTTRDGAVVRCVAGGGVMFLGTSFIVKKTRLLFGVMPTDVTKAVANYGTNANVLPWLFLHTSCELRIKDKIGDAHGYQRVTLVRYERPHMHASDTTLRPDIRFDGERLTVQADAIDVLHLTSGVTLSWLRCRMAKHTTAWSAHVVQLLTQGTTAVARGRLVAMDSTLLEVRAVGKTVSGAVWEAPDGLGHIVSQDNGYPPVYNPFNPVRTQQQQAVAGVATSVRRAEHFEADGSIMGQRANRTHRAGTVRRLLVPPGSRLVRCGITLTNLSAGNSYAGDIVLRFRNTANTKTYAELTARWAATKTARESLTANGRKLDVHRRPHAEVEETAAADGEVVVEVVAAGRSRRVLAYGAAWVEYA